jgi:hypothetical protein
VIVVAHEALYILFDPNSGFQLHSLTALVRASCWRSAAGLAFFTDILEYDLLENESYSMHGPANAYSL